ncbi:MAG: hypothetical protein NVSMB9_36690 [Isosphaeraceae bacterium]
MNPSHPSNRRRRESGPAPEVLESRSLMTGGAGNTFAILSGEITKPNQPAAIKFTIDPAHFTIPKGKFILGIDVAPDPNSGLSPRIVSLSDAKGHVVSRPSHSVYDAHVKSAQITPGSSTSAVVTPVRVNAANPHAPVTYTVSVKGVRGSTGKFLMGFYLPGDLKGTGTVTAEDMKGVQSVLGSRSRDKNYNFDADMNRDGRVGPIDLAYTRQNLGVSTNISPVVSAVLDHADETTPNSRAVRKDTAHFTGSATPGAAVKFEEIGKLTQPVATTADAKGNYEIHVPLGEAKNTFKITTVDSFGQSIEGTIPPVTRIPSEAVTLESLAALTRQTVPIVKPRT